MHQGHQQLMLVPPPFNGLVCHILLSWWPLHAHHEQVVQHAGFKWCPLVILYPLQAGVSPLTGGTWRWRCCHQGVYLENILTAIPVLLLRPKRFEKSGLLHTHNLVEKLGSNMCFYLDPFSGQLPPFTTIPDKNDLEAVSKAYNFFVTEWSKIFSVVWPYLCQKFWCHAESQGWGHFCSPDIHYHCPCQVRWQLTCLGRSSQGLWFQGYQGRSPL